MSADLAVHHEPATWHCLLTVAKFEGLWTPEKTPYQVDEYEHNMLMFGGVSNLWQCLIGNGGSGALAYFNTANAAIGVGDSTTVASASHTDLQAATNKLRKGMGAGFPSHTDGTGSAANTIRFRSTFDTTEANFAWNEAGIFNSVTAGAGRMLNRKVQSMGTKTSASSWQITFDISIS